MVASGRDTRNIPQKSKSFHGFLGMQIDAERKGGGGQGWIRTSVRLRGQIYSLLPLTTRPPVHTGHFAKEIEGSEARSRAERRPFGEAMLACQCPRWHRPHTIMQTGRI